ncbi:DUF1419 domain-containing protein [Hoeflea sp.]|uniref:DUF1419 domain-containing protein n=1 Tax=Hoeflea sp. TaxID=1940281 RepID=UPI003A911454
MISLPPIREIYFGITDRRQMFRLFDRHAQRLDRWQNEYSALCTGERFEIAPAEHDYMLEVLPPLRTRDAIVERERRTFKPIIREERSSNPGASPKTVIAARSY